LGENSTQRAIKRRGKTRKKIRKMTTLKMSSAKTATAPSLAITIQMGHTSTAPSKMVLS